MPGCLCLVLALGGGVVVALNYIKEMHESANRMKGAMHGTSGGSALQLRVIFSPILNIRVSVKEKERKRAKVNKRSYELSQSGSNKSLARDGLELNSH